MCVFVCLRQGRDVSKDARAMAKLFQTAEKVKRVLSANKDTKAQIEGNPRICHSHTLMQAYR